MSLTWCARLGHSVSFFLNDPATTEIYPLSLHDALPIWVVLMAFAGALFAGACLLVLAARVAAEIGRAHVLTPVTSGYLVCRLLLVKKSSAIHISIIRDLVHVSKLGTR